MRPSSISCEPSTELSAKRYADNQNYQFTKATYDSEKYEYEEAVAYKRSNAQRLGERLAETEKTMNEYKEMLDKTDIDLVP